jgi:Flp pilus assembly protein TadG
MHHRLQYTQSASGRSQRGVAAIELAILIVPLLLMLFGVTEYGRAIYQYNTLAKSVRDATRYLSTVDAGDKPDIVNGGSSVYANAKCLAVHGNYNCSGNPLVPGLTTAMVSICDASNCPDHNGQGAGSVTVNLVTVTIQGYVFYPLPFNLSYYGETVGLPSTITFDPIRNTMRQAS